MVLPNTSTKLPVNETGTVRFATLRELFSPKNMSFLFLNVLIFIVVQFVFQWFVSSRLILDVTLELTNVPINYYKQNPEAAKRYCKDTDPDKEENKETFAQFEADKKEIEAQNWETVQEYLYPPVILLTGLTLLQMMIMVHFREAFNRYDLVVLFVVFAAFGTELFYYYGVVQNIVFIGEQQILSETLSPGSTFEWSTPVFPDNRLYVGYNKETKEVTNGHLCPTSF